MGFDREERYLPRSPTEEEIERWIWMAGRPRLAGLPAARQGERDRERAEAIHSLAGDIEERGPRRSAALRRIRELFQSPRTNHELWSACARVAGELELYEFAEFLVPPLLEGVSDPRHLAAATALHALFGRWFVRAEELLEYLENVRGGADTALLLATLSEQEELSRRRLFAFLGTDPVRSLEFLDDRDPRIRGGAALILGQAFALEGVDTGAIYKGLLDMLEIEEDPIAFHQALEALVPPLELAEPRDRSLESLRYLLGDVATSDDDARAMSAVRVLKRLPWATTGSVEAEHILSGVGLVGESLRVLAAAERRRGAFDPDPLVSAFQSLEVLCQRAVEAGLSGALRGSTTRGNDDSDGPAPLPPSRCDAKLW